MKKYKKYKNFIPYSFYLKNKECERKKEKRLISIFLIFNLLIVPINIKDLNMLIKKDVKSNISGSYTEEESFQVKIISSAVNKLLSDEFEEVYIDNGSGEILVEGLESIDRLKDENILNINEAFLIDGKKYKIGVIINE